MKRIKTILKYTFIVAVCLELALWVLGFRPYRYIPFKVDATPENAILGDSLLGFKLNPGTFEITLQDSLVFKTTHTVTGQRHVPHSNELNPKGQIHFYGCSYTYGYGVDDHESFPAIIQETFPKQTVFNHAVMGYGTGQSVIQVQNTEEIEANDLVLLCFSDAHFKRNVLSNAYRLHLKIGFENSAKKLKEVMTNARFPYRTTCQEKFKYESWENIYEHWPLREYSPGINFVQSQFERIVDNRLDEVAITACLIEEMAAAVGEKEATFLVVCLDSSEETKRLQDISKVPYWLNVNFDFADTTLTNHPYDQHANVIGNKTIATKLIPFVASFLNE